jgi:AraC-like DNA-binding protein
MGYLRRIRLSEAHRTLQEADPESSTVTGVAARWGFYHAGRFAAEYRAAYGQSPGTTLKA